MAADNAARIDSLTAGQVMTAIADALKARDFDAVVALMKVLAFKDPRQAQEVYDAMTAVLNMTGATAGEETS